MKKAEEYIPKVCAVEEILHSNSNKPFWSKEFILKIIKQVQIDTIQETVQACADYAVVEVVDHEEWLIDHLPANDNRGYTILPVYGVDDQSILEVADKLIKELE